MAESSSLRLQSAPDLKTSSIYDDTSVKSNGIESVHSMTNSFDRLKLGSAPSLHKSSVENGNGSNIHVVVSSPRRDFVPDNPQASITQEELYTSLVATDNSFPIYIETYYSLIVEFVNSAELLRDLYDIVDNDERIKIRQLTPCKGTTELLEYLKDKKDCPGKWQRFVQALQLAGYQHLATALSRGDKLSDLRGSMFTNQMKLVELFARPLTNKIAPLEICPDLKSRDVLNDVDVQEIEAEKRNFGDIAGAVILIDRVWRRNTNWFPIFMDVLMRNGYQSVVKEVDEDVYNKLMGKLQERESLETSHSETYEKEPYTAESKSRFESWGKNRNDTSVKENYISASGNPQNSVNNYSPNMDGEDKSYEKLLGDLGTSLEGSRGEESMDNTKLKVIGNRCRGDSIASSVSLNVMSPSSGDPETSMESVDQSGPIDSMMVANMCQDISRIANAGNIRSPNINSSVMAGSVINESIANLSEDEEEDETGPPKRQLVLRKYQEELAEPALSGKNCIIVAPTGSGKTHVALKIIQTHMDRIRRQRIPKIAFLVEQSALAEQQGKQCKDYLPCKVKVITGETQRTERLNNLSEWLQSRNILVVTAQILVNALMDRSVSIGDFSLMIFDECHHAHAKHSYNQIMIHYMDVKFDPNYTKPLPQIVGLTASVGVGRARKQHEAISWIETMMANMDAEELATVIHCRAELSEHVNIPQQVVKKVLRREKDYFGQIIIKIMEATEKHIKDSRYSDNIEEKSFLKSPSEKGSDKYTQWLSGFRREIAKVNDELSRRFLHTCRKYLDLYNRALIIYSDAQAFHALKFIKEELNMWKEMDIPDETDVKMLTMFEKSENMLMKFTTDKRQNNPKLDLLKNLIIKAYSEKPDSRGIIFVKTRDLVKAIEAWMNQTEGLKQLNPIKFVGAQASSSVGGMTKHEQDQILQYFRDGKHKLIIATSVAEEGLDIQKCNLVVRYDHVTNEIAMVQSRGRGRADDSKYVVVAEDGRGTAEREEINMMRENMMNNAILELKAKVRANKAKFREHIESLQKRAKFERDLEDKNRKGSKARMGEFELRCIKCSNFICMSTDIKKIQNAHHAALCDDIKERVMAKKIPRPTFQDEDLQCGVGKLLCKECGSPLGNVSIYKAAQFPILKIDNFVLVDNIGNRDVVKKWKSVPFIVQQLTDEDLQRRSRGDNLVLMT